jgi:hypothetical protein
MSDVNYELCVSELGLRAIADTEFNTGSWTIWEKHTDYAVDIVTATVYNLWMNEFIRIDAHTVDYKIFNHVVFQRTEYLVQLIKQPGSDMVIGWFEQHLFFELRKKSNPTLKSLLHDVLNKMFSNYGYFINSGKTFLIDGLKNQNCLWLDFSFIYKWFSEKVKVSKMMAPKDLLDNPRLEEFIQQQSIITKSQLQDLIRNQFYLFGNRGD